MKRGNLELPASQAIAPDRKTDTALVDLMRLLARQAAREWSEQQPADGRFTPLSPTEKQS
jgi:hypothetical protein